MSRLVQVQTLRGNSGVAAATQAVTDAVAKFNAQNGTADVVQGFVALPPNVKGMQVHLSLLAVLARSQGATLIRLSVHNGNVVLCGPQADVDAVLAAWTPAYNALVTQSAAVYNVTVHGPRMGFNNAFQCGLIAGMDTTPAVLAYGLGGLFTFPAPGNGSAYNLGIEAATTYAPKSAPAKRSKVAKRGEVAA